MDLSKHNDDDVRIEDGVTKCATFLQKLGKMYNCACDHTYKNVTLPSQPLINLAVTRPSHGLLAELECFSGGVDTRNSALNSMGGGGLSKLYIASAALRRFELPEDVREKSGRA